MEPQPLVPHIRKGILLLYLLFGVALFWAVMFHLEAGASWRAIRGFDHRFTVAVLALVATNLALRFMRWQFLLRKASIRIGTRESLSLFLATLALIITPLYIGEVFKPYLLKKRHGIQMRRGLAVVIMERYFDLLALVLLTLVHVGSFVALGPWKWLVWAVAVPVVAAAAFPRLRFVVIRLFSRLRILVFFGAPLRPSTEVFRAVNTPAVFLQALAASVAAWAAAGLGLWMIATGAGVASFNPAEAIASFAAATTAGAATLLPGGIGAMEVTLATRLEAVTAPHTAWAVVLLVRLLTLWFAVAVGGLVLFIGYRRFVGVAIEPTTEHFAEIAPVYDAQIPPHMRQHFLDKKIPPMQEVLSRHGIDRGRGLDIGCGTGWYAEAMTERGHDIVGFDQSAGQVAQYVGRVGGEAKGAVADACRLPFADDAFDFAYAINIIHHLPDRDAQATAMREIHRVLRPGGLFFLHEINVVNPLNRLYMVFVFPVMKDIDEGTEHWILPDEEALFGALRKREIRFFTFLPDFMPRALLTLGAGLERRLERSPAKRMSAHYMMVLQRETDPA